MVQAASSGGQPSSIPTRRDLSGTRGTRGTNDYNRSNPPTPLSSQYQPTTPSHGSAGPQTAAYYPGPEGQYSMAEPSPYYAAPQSWDSRSMGDARYPGAPAQPPGAQQGAYSVGVTQQAPPVQYTPYPPQPVPPLAADAMGGGYMSHTPQAAVQAHHGAPYGGAANHTGAQQPMQPAQQPPGGPDPQQQPPQQPQQPQQHGPPTTSYPYGAASQHTHDVPPCSPGAPIQTHRDGQVITCGPDGCNLFVFHIPNDLTNAGLYSLFAAYGPVLSVRIMVDKATGRSRGFGFVSYERRESAEAAIRHMDGYKIGHKRLKVQHKRQRSYSVPPGDDASESHASHGLDDSYSSLASTPLLQAGSSSSTSAPPTPQASGSSGSGTGGSTGSFALPPPSAYAAQQQHQQHMWYRPGPQHSQQQQQQQWHAQSGGYYYQGAPGYYMAPPPDGSGYMPPRMYPSPQPNPYYSSSNYYGYPQTWQHQAPYSHVPPQQQQPYRPYRPRGYVGARRDWEGPRGRSEGAGYAYDSRQQEHVRVVGKEAAREEEDEDQQQQAHVHDDEEDDGPTGEHNRVHKTDRRVSTKVTEATEAMGRLKVEESDAFATAGASANSLKDPQEGVRPGSSHQQSRDTVKSPTHVAEEEGEVAEV